MTESSMTAKQLLLLLALLFVLNALNSELAAAFQVQNPRRFSTHLNADISEWRDLIFDPPEPLKTAERPESSDVPLREVCVLPFPLNDILLQGETKELCLYEKRFHQLFEKSTNNHAGVVAMGLMAPPGGILQSMPLCEIENFQTLEGDTGFGKFSILATIRVVGRASLVGIHDKGEEFLTGWCTELGDDTTTESGRKSDAKDVLKIGNELADDIEDVFDHILFLEDQLVRELDDDDDDDDEDLVLSGVADDEDEDYEGEDEDELDEDSPKAIFQKAFQVAKSWDTQGYRITSGNTPSGREARSIQDLTALSWAYLSQDLWDPDEILDYRLRALEVDDLCERLKIVLSMLKEQRSNLKETLKSRESEDE